MNFDFFPMTKSTADELDLNECSNEEIIEMTCIEDLTINTDDDLKDFFFIHVN